MHCPNCNSERVVHIVYGYPSSGLMEAAMKKEVALGGCLIEDDNPSHKCLSCDSLLYKSTEELMIEFCNDSLEALKNYDNTIYENISQSLYPEFYRKDVKGIGIYSITEPILKFIIYSSLCSKYQMWPESSFYKDKELLDIAMFSDVVDDIEIEIEPDIAIEMKWVAFTKSGEFYKQSLQNMVADIEKLHTKCDIQNKYIMQFSVVKSDNHKINDSVLSEQVFLGIDKRKVKKKNIDLIYHDYFNTRGWNEADIWRFYILLWKIE